MIGRRRGQNRPPTGPDRIRPAAEGASAFLIARALAVRPTREGRGGIQLRFRIQHLMWLSLWTAIVLAVREPLVASIPEAVKAVVWLSAGLAAALVVVLYGIALMMPEGSAKDELVLALLYILAGDLALFLVFLLLDARK